MNLAENKGGKMNHFWPVSRVGLADGWMDGSEKLQNQVQGGRTAGC